jgi:hypothetical protein
MESYTMKSFEIVVPTVEVSSRGQSIKIDLTRLSDDILRALLAHGVIQKVGDAASAAKQQAILSKFGDEYNKADAAKWAETTQGESAIGDQALLMMQKAVDALYEGRWAIREGTGTRTRWTEEQTLALDFAKADLVARFKRACLAKSLPQKMESYPKLSEAVAKYFTEKAGKPVFKDEVVMEWLAAQAPNVDYMAKAREELAHRAAMVDAVDLDDLLADI